MENPEINKALSILAKASRQLVLLSEREVGEILCEIAELAIERSREILAANKQDLDRMDPKNPKYDRLLLNLDRLNGIAEDLRNVAALESPLDKILESRQLDSGLSLQKTTVPLGVIGIVYESRPNVTFDVFALCFKSGNAVALKGSKDAHFSNLAIVSVIKEVLSKRNLQDVIYLAPSERAALQPILEAVDYVDTIIPRGSQGLIDFVRKHSKVPVIETGAGIVHTYFDESGDLTKGQAIITNAKSRRVSVCNALDCLIIHESRVSDLPEIMKELLAKGAKVYADPLSYKALKNRYDSNLLQETNDKSYGTEFLALTMSIKTVGNLDEALDHIAMYSSKHSESIISEDIEAQEKFLKLVDAAVVYANTSTAFTDGAQFGLGAEIGISTQKLHARGPMALQELTSYKWLVRSNGMTRS